MREYVCDSCGSPAGMACVTRAGRFARFAHAARYAAAERDGKVGAEPTDQLTAAVERGHISVRAARRMGWTR